MCVFYYDVASLINRHYSLCELSISISLFNWEAFPLPYCHCANSLNSPDVPLSNKQNKQTNRLPLHMICLLASCPRTVLMCGCCCTFLYSVIISLTFYRLLWQSRWRLISSWVNVDNSCRPWCRKASVGNPISCMDRGIRMDCYLRRVSRKALHGCSYFTAYFCLKIRILSKDD